ncbi:MAG TPA: type II secretion system F family protein [Caulifigura sp.]|jgi:tight adherence protein C|nr:type II secretion system F family protein [Caulifigura sp.]
MSTAILSDYLHIWTGLAMSGSVYAIVVLLSHPDRRVESRIRTLEAKDSRPTRAGGMAQWFTPEEVASGELRMRLSRAGFQSPAAVTIYTVLQLSAATVGCVLGVWLSRSLPPRTLDGLLGALLGGCLGFLAPGYFLFRRTKKRQILLQTSLPDFLDLLVACLDAGLSLEGAMQRITAELQLAHPILGGELTRVQRDVELGATTDRALQQFADRSGIETLSTLASACAQSRRFGARLSKTLRGLSDSLRQQREQRAEEAAQIAAVKILFPTLLLLFPIIFIVLAGPAAIQIVEQFSQSGMVNGK